MPLEGVLLEPLLCGPLLVLWAAWLVTALEASARSLLKGILWSSFRRAGGDALREVTFFDALPSSI